MLAAEVITTDHQLEQIADRASGQLARHRWHWTLDESNPARVSVGEYAKAVGRAYSTIRVMALGFESHSQNDDASSLDEHIGRCRRF